MVNYPDLKSRFQGREAFLLIHTLAILKYSKAKIALDKKYDSHLYDLDYLEFK